MGIHYFPVIFSLALLLSACTGLPTARNDLIIHLDHQRWSFHQAGEAIWYPAAVPGTVHLDLMRNGIIDDPFMGMNEQTVQWIGEADWEYLTTFTVTSSMMKKDRIELVFEGLDTYAEVWLNGSLLFRADNMFIPWKADCKEVLKEGENELRVVFSSAVKKGLEKMKTLSYILPVSNEQVPADQRSSIFTRKAPFHYGWDWGPRLVTCGIWKPVYIEAWDKARITGMYFIPRLVTDSIARYMVNLEIESEKDSKYRIDLMIGDSSIPHRIVQLREGINALDLAVEIQNPVLWWPNGSGESYLYDVACTLKDNRKVIHRAKQKLGIRNLQRTGINDTIEGSFCFYLNGRPVFMKGCNYIPPDFFSPRITREKYNQLLDDMVKANMNMVRVWGGAVYEDDIFYDLCDEKGILVWQDFMFSCAMPPGDSAYLENVRKEAEHQVKRLRHHACLAIWCGNNENLSGWHNWGWKESFPKEISNRVWKNYEKIFYDILPSAVYTYDTQRSYHASSPSSDGNTLADRTSGDEHDWTVWFGQKLFSSYGENVARFVSEYGLQSVPDITTIRAFTADQNLSLSSPDIIYRQRCRMDWLQPGFTGNDMMLWYISRYYGEPSDFEETIYLSQLTQALGLSTAIEQHRKSMPWCMGSLFWQIDDCWPTLSWSTIDYYGNWKAAHYHVRRAYEKLLLVTDSLPGEILVHAVSDLPEPLKGTLQTTLLDFSGRIISRWSSATVIPSNTSTLIGRYGRDTLPPFAPESTVMVVAFVQGSDTVAEKEYYFRLPKDQALQKPDINCSVRKHGDGYIFSLTTDKLAHAVRIQVNEFKGSYSDNYFDMLPGRTYEILFHPERKTMEIVRHMLEITSYYTIE